MAGGNLVIDRLHVHARGGRSAIAANPVSLKLTLQQALRQVRLQQAHLPPQAILVIRHLESRSSFGLAAGEVQRWQRLIEEQLDDLAGRALRPGRQHIPPEANSVVFEDEVDLLLCYTRDLLAGRSAWYWAELFPDADYPGQATGLRLLTAFQAYPQAIPHTLVALKPRESTAALGHMARDQLSWLVRTLHDTFALPQAALDGTGSGQSSISLSGPAAAPWREWLPSHIYRELSPQAVYLLGLSHALVKRPSEARQPAFAQQARRWLEQATTASSAGGPQASDPLVDNMVVPDTLAEDSAVGTTTTGDNLVAMWGEARAFSRLGGAFFFINLLTRLKLPSAIPEMAALNPWELLGGLAAALLGRRFTRFLNDPLWEIVNELAGLEPGQPWGASLPAPGNFLLPAAWLAHLPPATIAVHNDPSNDRLRVWARNPDYLIADLSDSAVPKDLTDLIQDSEEWTNLIRNANHQFDNDLELWSDLNPDIEDWPSLADGLLSPSLVWWVRRLQPYLGQFLIYLSGDLADPIETLFHQPVTIYLSRTHVDLLLSMEQISIPLRRAGLDQSPGWRPEFGYIVSIHFE